MSVKLGATRLPNPVMPAAGTYGLGVESAAYGDLSSLGCFTTKSLSVEAWDGNAGRNLIPSVGGGMLNSVGLKNPGVQRWLDEHYVDLHRSGCRVVVSLWGRTEADIFDAASLLAQCESVIAVELNLSCPNHSDPRFLVAHDPVETSRYVAAATEALETSHIAVWAKLSPTTPDLVSIAEAATANGADAVTLVNTLSGMAVDIETMSGPLSGFYGGLSGPPLHPVALRAINQVHSALPEVPIIGVGGVGSGVDALSLMAVGASAVQVGSASFRDPRAPFKVLDEVTKWCASHGVCPPEVTGAIRGNAFSQEI